MRRTRLFDVTLLTIGLWALFVVPANAYIDAGSTTVIFQTVLAALVAGSISVKLYWRRLVLFLRRDDDADGDLARTDGPADADTGGDVPLAAAEDR